LCDIAIVFDLVLELVFLDKVGEFVETRTPRLVDVVIRLLIGKDVVDAARLALLLVTALQALEPGLRWCKHGP
jgi:hypothetical protein